MQKLFNIENELITTKYAITYHDIPFITGKDGSLHLQIHSFWHPNMKPMLYFPLLLAGTPISTCFIGEFVSHKEMVGILPKVASLMVYNKHQRWIIIRKSME